LKIRIATLSLTILCLALTAYAGTTTFYNDGGIDGNDNGFYITGPSFPNPAGSFQDISNGFIAAASGAPNQLEFGEWVLSGSTPTSIGYEIGTTAFGTDLGFGTVTQNSSNSVFLFTNGFGYGIYDVTIPVTSGAMTAGNTYWVSLSNAANTGSTQSGAWDIPNGGSGGPATCNFRQSGTNYGSCGLGGESFTLTGQSQSTTPEPSSILLFGSGILGLAGVLRRKLNR
jgi:PEP-CTERM motif